MDYLIGHLVGDYLVQNDWMAKRKKTETWPCLVHCTIYAAMIASFTGWPIWAVLLTFVLHFIQDRTRIINLFMELNGQSEFLKPPLGPWSIIVVDNCFHLLFLWATSYAVLARAVPCTQ